MLRYARFMNAGTLVQQARRRAGLTQAELARRCGTTQSAIARVEAGRSQPSLERATELVAACGMLLSVSLTPTDEAELAALQRNLDLSPEQRITRVTNLARFVAAGRAANAADG